MIFRHTYSELVLTEHSQGSRALRINKIDCPMIIPLSYYTLPYFGLILDGCCSATVSSCFGYFPKKNTPDEMKFGIEFGYMISYNKGRHGTCDCFFFLNMKHRYWSLWPMILKYILRYNDDIPSNAYINMDWFKGNSTGNHIKKSHSDHEVFRLTLSLKWMGKL